jgi:hypothetical protein
MKTSTHRNADVERYIHELAIALAGLPVEDREDVITGVREHIDASLADIAEPDHADVARILEGLGDPLAIAADAGAQAERTAIADTTQTATPPGPATPSPPPGPVAPPTPTAGQTNDEPLRASWVPPVAVLTLAVGTAMLVLGGPGLLTLTGLLWLVGFVLLVASPLWRAGEVARGLLALFAREAGGGGGRRRARPRGGRGRPRRRGLIPVRDELRFLPGFFENVAPQGDGIVALDDQSSDESAAFTLDVWDTKLAEAGTAEGVRLETVTDASRWPSVCRRIFV